MGVECENGRLETPDLGRLEQQLQDMVMTDVHPVEHPDRQRHRLTGIPDTRSTSQDSHATTTSGLARLPSDEYTARSAPSASMTR